MVTRNNIAAINAAINEARRVMRVIERHREFYQAYIALRSVLRQIECGDQYVRHYPSCIRVAIRPGNGRAIGNLRTFRNDRKAKHRRIHFQGRFAVENLSCNQYALFYVYL